MTTDHHLYYCIKPERTVCHFTTEKETNEDTSCKICHAGNETFENFLLYCPAYQVERQKTYDIQQPYGESVDEIIGTFLFCEGNIENKEILWKMWKIRDEYLRN